MSIETDFWTLEDRFWTQGADSARKMSATNAIFVFPDPTGILSSDAVWREADVAQRWRTVDMRERQVSLKNAVCVLAYRAFAERNDEPIYEALCTSTYLKDGDAWLRLTHQQTPVR